MRRKAFCFSSKTPADLPIAPLKRVLRTWQNCFTQCAQSTLVRRSVTLKWRQPLPRFSEADYNVYGASL
jgi:hypothetical protein